MLHFHPEKKKKKKKGEKGGKKGSGLQKLQGSNFPK